jgi:hypothetical protein
VQVRLFRYGNARVTGPSWVADESRRSRIGEDGERIIGG